MGTSINRDEDCNCLDKAYANYSDTYVRRVGDSKALKERDFKSHIERGKMPETEECDEICGLRGVSIEVWNGDSQSPLTEKYMTTYAISPKLKYQLGVFKMKHGAGLVKHTPNQPHGINKFHYDFYKDERFVIGMLDLVELIPLVKGDV